MNSNQVSKKEMMDAVNGFLDTHAEKWTAIPKVGQLKNKLVTINNLIERSHEGQQGAQVYVGKNKKQIKSTIAAKADILNDIVEAYAGETNNAELESRMADSYSDLNGMRNMDFVPKVKEIIKEVENRNDVLKNEYGLTEEQVEDIKADLDQFLALIGQPRAYRISSIQSTKDLEQLFSEANDLLINKLDKVMKIFKRRDQNFYNGYLAARMVVND